MRIRNLFLGLVVATGFFFAAKDVFAIEGTVKMRSITNEPYRCLALYARLQTNEYRILMNCINILYPADSANNLLNYILWATPTKGTAAIRLGAIGLGSGEYKTTVPFSKLFVTIEGAKSPKTPTGKVVMEGPIVAESYLLGPSETPTPTPELDATNPETNTASPTPSAEQVAGMSTKDKLLLALKRAGLAAGIALVALIGLVFVITRTRS